MKSLLAIYMLIFAGFASAQGMKVVKQDNCMSSDYRTTVKLVYDSTFSIYGAKVFEINGFKVKRGGLRMLMGDTFTRFEGRLERGDKFVLITRSGKTSRADLKLNGQSEVLKCTSNSKRLLYWNK